MEYYAAVKKNAVTKCAEKWMGFTNCIIFSEGVHSISERKRKHLTGNLARNICTDFNKDKHGYSVTCRKDNKKG